MSSDAENHISTCEIIRTGRYTEDCPGCLHDANQARERIDELDRRIEAKRATQRKNKRAMAIERISELISHLEEHRHDAVGEGNTAWSNDLELFLSALYAAELPDKDGTVRVKMNLVDAVFSGKIRPAAIARPRPRATWGFAKGRNS
jgi:hypothetical protein